MGGSVLSGMAPWLMLGAILGEMMIGLALQLCQVIRPGLGDGGEAEIHPGNLTACF